MVFVLILSETFELEVNENVQLAVNDRQMPKVEYMEIKIDDYSKYLFSPSTIIVVKWHSISTGLAGGKIIVAVSDVVQFGKHLIGKCYIEGSYSGDRS